MLTVLVCTISNSQAFLLKNVSSFCTCKSYLHFFSKNISICTIVNDQSFNDTLINDIVSFEQLCPDEYEAKRICEAETKRQHRKARAGTHYQKNVPQNMLTDRLELRLVQSVFNEHTQSSSTTVTRFKVAHGQK